MYAISDRCFLEVKIGGQVLPVNGSMIKELTIIQNIQMVLPSLRMHLNDPSGSTLDQFPIVDGTKIEVTIGGDRNVDTAQTSVFRAMGAPPSRPGRTNPELHIRAFLDAPRYLSGQPTRGYNMTSSDAVRMIAEECGLTPQVDDTDDKMAWLPFNRRFGSFVGHLADHSWAGPSSVFSFGVDERRNLYYRNVDKIITGSPQSRYYVGNRPSAATPRPQRVVDHQIKVSSGVLNNWVGYGYRIRQTGLDGADSSYEQVEATRLNNRLDVSRDMQSTIGASRREYAPPDCGNTHANFMRARHQNRRLRSLYGTDIHVLTEHATDDWLFDLVQFEGLNQVTGGVNSGVSGSYLVTAKARTIRGNGYYEKLVLTGQGRQSENPTSPTV